MRKRLLALLLIVSATLMACGEKENSDISPEVEDVVLGDTEEESVPEEEGMPQEEYEGYHNLKFFDIYDTYDTSDDETLKNGMRTEVNSETEEKEFISYFAPECYDFNIIEEGDTKVYFGENGDENIVIFFINYGEDEFPKTASGFKYSESKASLQALYDASKKGDELFDHIYSLEGNEEPYEYIKCISPLLDYQEQTEYRDDDNKLVKVEYSSDQYEYGTYNSTGEVLFDSKERPYYRNYYVTSGCREAYYLYNDNDELIRIYDFGGLAYKGLEENQYIEIGVDFDVYIFER